MHDWNGDWDILYPFSGVSDIRLEATASYTDLSTSVHVPIQDTASHRAWVRVEAVNATVDALAGTRSLTLEITHPGLIWTGKSSRLSSILLV